ncbi:cation:proton antiporter [Shewanella sp. 4_MG-2023]|uniref:cation:proton antiporter n=1 Tax=Shewanella sp. 4_MG-2023 TaxID=3062652 RepID=UPI0026E37CA5|nr:cation:proton antiporter [Shewanella sp. 4_MG-2023]MDO6677048.1 cation:proton antiporter [Shewanella sp. 4_MG-2023]
MNVDQFVISLCLILFLGKLFGEIFQRFELPEVVGEILAGLLLGPSLTNVISPDPTLTVLAELGVILLLFSIGCESSIKRLYQAGGRAVSVALVGNCSGYCDGREWCLLSYRLNIHRYFSWVCLNSDEYWHFITGVG